MSGHVIANTAIAIAVILGTPYLALRAVLAVGDLIAAARTRRT